VIITHFASDFFCSSYINGSLVFTFLLSVNWWNNKLMSMERLSVAETILLKKQLEARNIH